MQKLLKPVELVSYTKTHIYLSFYRIKNVTKAPMTNTLLITPLSSSSSKKKTTFQNTQLIPSKSPRPPKPPFPNRPASPPSINFHSKLKLCSSLCASIKWSPCLFTTQHLEQSRKCSTAQLWKYTVSRRSPCPIASPDASSKTGSPSGKRHAHQIASLKCTRHFGIHLRDVSL